MLAAGAAAGAAGAACKSLSIDPNEVIALDVSIPDSGRIEIPDTIVPHSRALNGRGDSVAATIVWSRLDTTVLVVDSQTGATIGLVAGASGRIQARAGNLRSSLLTLAVWSPADSLTAGGAVRDTVVASAPDSLSDSLQIRLFATPASAANLAGRRIALTVVFPSGAPPLTLVPKDTLRTDGTGLAVFQVRLVGGPLPDSAVVTAQARRADGTPVPGSPVTFVVEFQP